jgi:hypothetical protein
MKRFLQVLPLTYLASICSVHAVPGDVDLAFDSGSAGGFEPGVIRNPHRPTRWQGHARWPLFEIGGPERNSIARLNADGLRRIAPSIRAPGQMGPSFPSRCQRTEKCSPEGALPKSTMLQGMALLD